MDAIDVEELLVSYRVPDDFLRIASALAPGTAVPRGVRRAPWAAVAVRTQRRGQVARALAARMGADVGSVGVIVPEALHDEVAADLGPGRDRGRGVALERRQPARPRARSRGSSSTRPSWSSRG